MSHFAKNALLEHGYNEEAAYQAGLLSRNEENFHIMTVLLAES